MGRLLAKIQSTTQIHQNIRLENPSEGRATVIMKFWLKRDVWELQNFLILVIAGARGCAMGVFSENTQRRALAPLPTTTKNHKQTSYESNKLWESDELCGVFCDGPPNSETHTHTHKYRKFYYLSNCNNFRTSFVFKQSNQNFPIKYNQFFQSMIAPKNPKIFIKKKLTI